MAEPWRIGVLDLADRPDKDLTVRREGRHLLIGTPAPGLAKLAVDQVTQLIEVLREWRNEIYQDQVLEGDQP